MNKMHGAFALVTGASKGLGKAIAKGLAQKGYNLLLVARSEAALASLSDAIQAKYGVTAFYFALNRDTFEMD